MLARISLLLAVLLFPAIGHTQAYKCRTPSGKVIITSDGCADGARLEQVTTAAPVSLEQRRQKAEVDNRMLTQLAGIAKEKALYSQQLKQHQEAWAIADREEMLRKAKEDRANAQKRCLDNAASAMSDVRAEAMASCYGVRLEQPEPKMQQVNEPPAAPAPPSVIKSCYGNSCRDQMGNRYTADVVGNITNSQGQRCHQRGKVMYCN